MSGKIWLFLVVSQVSQQWFMPIDNATIQLSLEEVPMLANPKVLVEVDDNSALIVCDQQGILE